MARLPQHSGGPVTPGGMVHADRIQATMGAKSRPEVLHMSLHTILLILALICFILEALGSRMRFRAPFGLIGAGLAFLTAGHIW